MSKTFRFIIFSIFVISINPDLVFSASCPCEEVSDAKKQEYNALLNLSDEQKEDAEGVHLPWGAPKAPSAATNERILHQQDYIIGYDDDLRVPLWVAYRLTTADLSVNRERLNCFRKDPRLSDAANASCDDYNEDEEIFDQGHMVPNADMLRTEAAMINTYIYSNIAPQHDKFNRGIWAYFESYVRRLVKKKGELYIISGSVFDKDVDGKRDPDNDADRVEPLERVAIPTHFYKIILYERSNGFIETMTILLPHTDQSITGTVKKDKRLRDNLTTIDAIEDLTGIDFFEDLPNNKETAAEAFQAQELWPSVGN